MINVQYSEMIFFPPSISYILHLKTAIQHFLMTVIAVFCSLFYSRYSNKSLKLTSKSLNSCHSARHMTPILAKLHMGNSDLNDYTKFGNLVSSSNKQKTQISNKNVRFDNICCNEI